MHPDQDQNGKTANRLAKEKSPYLLQHAENPVDWFPWGEEAFGKAREEGKPVFLSIGYATCHWCHVMAHESFEDEEVARVLKESFVSIKVDREERPDVDGVYMTACQAMTKGGGWPLSIFMTPEGKPFFAGTYFPKKSRMGMTGFVDLLKKISELWSRDRARFEEAGEQITQALQPRSEAAGTGFVSDMTALSKACEQLASSFDPTWGGFGQAPKFPMPHNLTFLVRWFARSGTESARTMTRKTLTSMRNGGIFDQIGFGFHRYSVDEKWLVPHFEKMLYDQALLALAYTEACQAFGEDRLGAAAREIFTYVLRDMTSPEGGFFFSGKENETLIVPSKEAYDGALPSGNSVAASNLVRLGRAIGKTEWEERAEQTLQAYASSIAQYPAGFTQFLAALDFMIGPSREIVIAGDPSGADTQAMLCAVQRLFLPNKVLVFRSDGEEGRRLSALAPYTEGMGPVDEQPAAYICEKYACKSPLTDLADLRAELASEQAR